jgi:Flp pilus assembly protein TadG
VNTEQCAVARPRARRRHSRGQAIVEFTLIAPVFFLLIFGTIEFSLLLASIGNYNFATREGARFGSVIGRTDGTVDQQIVWNLAQRVQGTVTAIGSEVDIYKAASDGTCLDSSGLATAIDSSSCLKNVYALPVTVASYQSITCTICNWPVNSRNDSLLNADYMGVRVKYQYTYLTAFFTSGVPTVQLVANSTQRIEPQDYGRRHDARPTASVFPGSDAIAPWAAMLPPWQREDLTGGVA